MLILGICPGHHDAIAVVFDDDEILAAVQFEWLTRVKIDGGAVHHEAVDACLAGAGAKRYEVDAPCPGRATFPSRHDTHLTVGRRLERALPIADVHPHRRDRNPALVHVDGTAEPQIIERAVDPLHADILAGFRQASGLPVSINTSFNLHEGPVIKTPAVCARAPADDRIDDHATKRGVCGQGASTDG